jgi:cytochrome P450
MCIEPTEFTDEDIAAQALTFFTDGYETSSTALSVLMYDLACNPDVQQRLREEVDAVMEEHNGELNPEIIHKMVYLEMVVQGKTVIKNSQYQVSYITMNVRK